MPNEAIDVALLTKLKHSETITVDLAADQKGVHMSRFPELFDEAIDGVVHDEALLIEQLAEHIASRIVERQTGAPGRGDDSRALADPPADAGHEALDAGDGDADRDRRRLA